MRSDSIRDNLRERGFAIVDSFINESTLGGLQSSLQNLTDDANGYGVRNLLGRAPCVAQFAASSTVTELMHELIGPSAICVRAILFDKNPTANWKVPWHQDTTIALKRKWDVAGHGPWSVKEGVVHVRPPAQVLSEMLTLRLHLDDCGPDNGPLRVIPASHQHGILDDAALSEWKQKPAEICTCRAGDVLLMRPLLMHASSQATQPAHRRVVHLEFAGGTLGDGLEWNECASRD